MENNWKPLERVVVELDDVLLDTFGENTVIKNLAEEVWQNDKYQVSIYVFKSQEAETEQRGPDLVQLSIRRLDRQPVRDWRDFQLIKNQCVGPECEGFELYPAESRLVDTSNQYHIWVIRDPKYRMPVGFDVRLVSEDEVGRSQQRPFYDNMKPKDLADMAEVIRVSKQQNGDI